MTNEERAALVKQVRRIPYTAFELSLADKAADQIEADGKRIAELKGEVERRKYDGIHTCHDQCQRVACVLRRRVDKLEAALQKINEVCVKQKKRV